MTNAQDKKGPGSIMDKGVLLGYYKTKLNHISLAYACVVYWQHPDSTEIFLQMHRLFLADESRGIGGLFPEIESFVRSKESLHIACEDMYASAHRTAVVELFAITKKYCHDTGQLDVAAHKHPRPNPQT
jgi:hypothetical protein